MTTYTATVSKYDDTFTMCELTTKKIKALRKDGYTVEVEKAVAVQVSEPVKFWYYRGEMVCYIEERQNGWTLVYSPCSGLQFYAVTAELEYK